MANVILNFNAEIWEVWDENTPINEGLNVPLFTSPYYEEAEQYCTDYDYEIIDRIGLDD